MNRIKFITNLIGILLCLVSSDLPKAMAHTAATADYSETASSAASDEVLEERIRNLQSNIDLKYTNEVRRSIRMYTRNYRRGSERLLGKVAIYFPLFEEEIRRKNLPDELKYLAIIESNLKPTAISHVGATGLWQFMKGTARMYDLEISRSVDERRDPKKSTEAALNYLADLYDQFGDWTVAIAAYNCGPGNVRKAIRRSNSRNYWKMRPYLPKETQDYVPRFVAANYLMNYYHAHGLNPQQMDYELVNTSSTKVYEQINFSDIKDKSGADYKLIQQLNPAYLRNYIPESEGGRYSLTLPKRYMDDFVTAIKKEEEPIQEEKEIIEVETIESRAFPPFKIPRFVDELNRLPETMPRQESESNSLDVLEDSEQVPVDIELKEAKALIEHKKQAKTRYEYYKLSKNESLYDLASKRRDVTVEDLLEINHYSHYNLPKPGTIIKLKEL